MTPVQIKLLEMLDYFHHFCVYEKLRYYVIGGTALGAARHDGFIPWDDDIDVGMPREDYERLKQLVQHKDLGKYLIEYPGDNKDFVYPFGKLYDTSTTLIEHTRYNTKRGIYIDIFPLDGIGNTIEESKKNFIKIDILKNLLSTRVCAIRKSRKLYKNVAIIVMRCIPGFIISNRKLIEKIEMDSKKYPFDNSVFVANLVGNWHEREIVKREWFGVPKEYNFHNIKVMGPENIDKFLTGIYGDWRKLPPIEKQVSHHDYLALDLNTPYKS